jgi:hypothetical protein
MMPIRPNTNYQSRPYARIAVRCFMKAAGNGWPNRPAHIRKGVPACSRIHDQYPAGYLTVSGAFFSEHREELLHLLRNEAERAKAEHPLKRIMQIEDAKDGVLVTTTDIHLARGLGEALHHAYQGTLEYHYNERENLLRVVWER